jgi:hypothetical protein
MNQITYENIRIWKRAIIIALFYILYFSVPWVAGHFSPSGPCTPGLGVILLLFLPLINIAWLIIEVIKSLRDQKLSVELIIQLIVCFIWTTSLVLS